MRQAGKARLFSKDRSGACCMLQYSTPRTLLMPRGLIHLILGALTMAMRWAKVPSDWDRSREAAPEPQLPREPLQRPPVLPPLPPSPGLCPPHHFSAFPLLPPLSASPILPAPAAWLVSSACGGSQWPHLYRRPLTCYPGGGPAGKSACEGRAEAARGTARPPAQRCFTLLQASSTPLDLAQRFGKDPSVALLRADPRVAAALTAAGKA